MILLIHNPVVLAWRFVTLEVFERSKAGFDIGCSEDQVPDFKCNVK